MKFTENRFIYETYAIYNYLDSMNKNPDYEYYQELNEIKTLQFKIYPEYEHLIKTVYKDKEGWEIQELRYKDYKLIYLSKYINVFLVNVLTKEENYPKDINIVWYNLGERVELIKEININNNKYKCLNVGKAFIEFKNENYKDERLSKDRINNFWYDFEKFLKGDTKKHVFKYEKFGEYIIVYKYYKVN